MRRGDKMAIKKRNMLCIKERKLWYRTFILYNPSHREQKIYRRHESGGIEDFTFAEMLSHFSSLLKKSFFSQTRSWTNKSKILSAGLPGADKSVFWKIYNKPKPFDGIIREICHPLDSLSGLFVTSMKKSQHIY